MCVCGGGGGGGGGGHTCVYMMTHFLAVNQLVVEEEDMFLLRVAFEILCSSLLYMYHLCAGLQNVRPLGGEGEGRARCENIRDGGVMQWYGNIIHIADTYR